MANEVAHRWVENEVIPERVGQRGERLPAMYWFPRCERCGCLVAAYSRGEVYRATPESEWTTTEPPCEVPRG